MLKVNTVKSGQEYRATVRGVRLLFSIGKPGYVVIYTPTSNLGLYKIERFGGSLSPSGIRKFVEANWPSVPSR